MKDASLVIKRNSLYINLLLHWFFEADYSRTFFSSSRFVSSGFHVVIYTTKTLWWMVNVMEHFMQVTCLSFTLLRTIKIHFYFSMKPTVSFKLIAAKVFIVLKKQCQTVKQIVVDFTLYNKWQNSSTQPFKVFSSSCSTDRTTLLFISSTYYFRCTNCNLPHFLFIVTLVDCDLVASCILRPLYYGHSTTVCLPGISHSSAECPQNCQR